MLVKLGMHAAGMFAARLAPLGLEPRQFGVLNRLAAAEGVSQQAIAHQLGLNTTRMVFLVDELERLGLAERRRNPADRRSHALYLTSKGREILGQARVAAVQHEALLCSSLTVDERRDLAILLRRLADGLGILAGGLPGTGRPPDC
jgi:DNA-binding MarR family transcriptional regulator